MVATTTIASAVTARFAGVESIIGNTPLLAIDYEIRGRKRTIFAKCEQMNFTGSIKDRMALHILRQAYAEGRIRPGDTIVEATSGNTGISFAALGRALGHAVTIFMPNWMSRERMDLIHSLGANIVPVTKAQGGFLGSIRMAEELAMIDMISKGRLVPGFVRGGGQEQLASGVNPAFNRERFIEAHELIQKIWTQPGPFRFEGTHYQHRVVNPWATPLQKPYPRVWVPGVLSKETIVWTAQQRYPYIALNTDRSYQGNLQTLFADRRRERLRRRTGKFWLSDPRARAGHRGKGAGQRASVHVDARRVHRPRARRCTAEDVSLR